MRKSLTAGTVIQLDCDGAKRQFQIDHVIGDGASCIAYDAHCLDTASGAYLCRIKECYPFHAKIFRDGNSLIWEDAGERDTAFAKMRKTHSVLVGLRNSSEVGNSITTAFLCEGNGTLYSVMEVNHAQTFDREEATDLYALLETMRVLTQIVGNLHIEVQIKITQSESVDINDIPQHLLVLFLHKKDGVVYEVYNGPCDWLKNCKRTKNGWYTRSLVSLSKEDKLVSSDKRLKENYYIQKWNPSIRNK